MASNPQGYFVQVSNPRAKHGPFSTMKKARAFAQRIADKLGRSVKIVFGAKKAKGSASRRAKNPKHISGWSHWVITSGTFRGASFFQPTRTKAVEYALKHFGTMSIEKVQDNSYSPGSKGTSGKWSMASIKEANKVAAERNDRAWWFAKDAMRFFGTKLEPTVYQGAGGVFFVASNKMPDSDMPRFWYVAEFHPEDGRVSGAELDDSFTAMESGQTKAQAIAKAKLYAHGHGGMVSNPAMKSKFGNLIVHALKKRFKSAATYTVTKSEHASRPTPGWEVTLVTRIEITPKGSEPPFGIFVVMQQASNETSGTMSFDGGGVIPYRSYDGTNGGPSVIAQWVTNLVSEAHGMLAVRIGTDPMRTNPVLAVTNGRKPRLDEGMKQTFAELVYTFDHADLAEQKTAARLILGALKNHPGLKAQLPSNAFLNAVKGVLGPYEQSFTIGRPERKNPVRPTVDGFLLILTGALTQYDSKQHRKGQGSPYALGHYMGAVGKIKDDMAGRLHSSEPADLRALKTSMQFHLIHDFSPVKTTTKKIDDYLATGKAPKYPIDKSRNPYRIVGERIPADIARREDLTEDEAIRISHDWPPPADAFGNQIQWSPDGRPPWSANADLDAIARSDTPESTRRWLGTKRRKNGANDVTVADLEEVGGNSLHGTEDLDGLAAELNGARTQRAMNDAFQHADKVLGTHGVEAIWGPNDSMHPIAQYLNTGDTYSVTLLNPMKGAHPQNQVLVTTWGDWLEKWERDNGETVPNPRANARPGSAKSDKAVIAAFLDKKSAIGKKLSTDGWRLDGAWMGGNGIAHWRGDKIMFTDLGSKAAATVQRAIRKAAPKNDLDEGWTRGSKKNPKVRKGETVTLGGHKWQESIQTDPYSHAYVAEILTPAETVSRKPSKMRYRIINVPKGPSEFGQGQAWRIDRLGTLDTIWEAVTPYEYDTPELAAREVNVFIARRADRQRGLRNNSARRPGSAKSDKAVIAAFTDHKAATGKKLHTDGHRLDGLWMGGNNLAEWSNGQIVFHDVGSKAAESVQRAIRKAAPKNDLDEGWTRGSKKNPSGRLVILWALPAGSSDRMYEQPLTSMPITDAQADRVEAAASKDGWHSFRRDEETGGVPDFTAGLRPSKRSKKNAAAPRAKTKRAPGKYAAFVKAQMPRFKHLAPKARMSAIAREWREKKSMN